MIKETTDYDMFKKHSSNRDLVEENLKKIMKSIQLKNLLEYRPILIDEKFYVIDGQHRLEAAKRLGVSIWYQIEKKSDVSDMFLLNANQRRWVPEDYLNFYCDQGKQDYIKLKAFMKKNNIILRQALKLLHKFKLKSTSRMSELFNTGNFVFSDPQQISDAEEILNKSKVIIEYITVKLPGNNYFLKSTKFMISIIDFLILYPIDFDEFMKKLSFKLDYIHPCSNIGQYLKIFIAIYNFRNKEPIVDL